MFEHIRSWNEWRKRNKNSKFHQFMVLIKLTRSPTYEFHKATRLKDETLLGAYMKTGEKNEKYNK